jgi:phage-related protein
MIDDMSSAQFALSRANDDTKKSVDAYSQALKESSMIVDLITKMEAKKASIERSGAEGGVGGDAYKSISSGIDFFKKSLNELKVPLREAGSAIYNLIKFTDTIKTLGTALRDVAAKDAVEATEGFRKMSEAINNLFGGSSVTAPQMVTQNKKEWLL